MLKMSLFSSVANFFILVGQKTNPIVLFIRLILVLIFFIAGVKLLRTKRIYSISTDGVVRSIDSDHVRVSKSNCDPISIAYHAGNTTYSPGETIKFYTSVNEKDKTCPTTGNLIDDKIIHRLGILSIILALVGVVSSVLWYYIVKRSIVAAGISGGVVTYDVLATLV